MKRLFLSLTLITGISLADTTDNQLNVDMEDGFLNGTYDYPNIHTHKQLGITDNTIFTGSSFYDNEASQTVNTSVIGELDQLDGINYGVDYYSQNRGTITLKADFYDDAGIFLDNDGGTYQITSGSWQSLTNTYNEAEYLNDIFTITITIGGESEYAYGTDDIQLRDAYVTYDYSEIPLVEILEDTTLDELIMDLIEAGAAVEFIEEFTAELEDIQEDFAEASAEEDIELEEDFEELAEILDEKETTENDNEQSDTTEPTESSDSSSSNDGSSINVDTSSSVSTSDALEILELVNSVTNNAQSSIFTNTLDFSSYTSISLSESVELEDNADWYQNQAFYESIGMTDSGIFVGYNKIKLKDGEWYGNDTEFY